MIDKEREIYRETVEKAAIALGVSEEYVESSLKRQLEIFKICKILLGGISIDRVNERRYNVYRLGQTSNNYLGEIYSGVVENIREDGGEFIGDLKLFAGESDREEKYILGINCMISGKNVRNICFFILGVYK